MTSKDASATVISLQSRRVARSQRRARARREAIRRHPSYQATVLRGATQHSDAVILEFRAPAS